MILVLWYTQSSFASVVLDGVLGPQRLTRHTLALSLFLCSSASIRYTSSLVDLKGHYVFWRVLDQDGGVARRNKRYQCPSCWGVIDLPSGQLNDFSYKSGQKIVLLPTPEPYLRGNPFLNHFWCFRRGFEALIEREWLQAGHPFWSRTTKGPFNDSVASKSKLHSPTFAMFLDCIFQVIRSDC